MGCVTWTFFAMVDLAAKRSPSAVQLLRETAGSAFPPANLENPLPKAPTDAQRAGTVDAPESGMAAVPHIQARDPKQSLVDDLMRELRERAVVAGDTRPVRLVETHISWVLLGPEVYKIKKPVTLPFLDFAAFEARERACRNEVRINRRLAPRTYLGVVPIRRRADGRFTLQTAGGPIVEWAVRMNRLDDAHNAEALLRADVLSEGHIDALAATIAAFHADSPSGPRIVQCGAPELLEAHVRENFEALRATDAISNDALTELERWQLAFVRGHADLFHARMDSGSIRDGHGDLRLEHVFLRGDDDFEILDGIEFDDRYRWSDVAADVAFLAMDLARLGRADLAERFIARYARAADDFALYRVVDFYESYRACIRAKIRPDDARRCLLLAESAGKRRLVEPSLVVVAGGIASGKSTLAEKLARVASAPIVDADRTRKHLLGLAPTTHASDGAWQGAYDPAFSELVYAGVLERAAAVLASGRPVIIDASFRTAKARAAAQALASEHNVPFRFLECVAPLEITRARLAARDPRASVSDATPAILDAFAKRFEPVTELCPTEHFRIDTSGPLDAAFAQATAEIPTWPRGLLG